MKKSAMLSFCVLALLSLIACNSRRRALDTGGLFPIVTKDRKWGYMDKYGNVVIQPQFEQIRFFSEGLACVSSDSKKFGFIDKTGHFVITPQYDSALSFAEGLAAVLSDSKTGYIDKTGRAIIPPQFEPFRGEERYWSASFSDGLAGVSLDDKWGYIDTAGKVVINPQFDKAFPFSLGLGLVKLGGKYGYIDNTGKFVINPQFDTGTPFSDEGIAGVRLGDKWGGIDKTGKIVINPQFEGNLFSKFLGGGGDFMTEILVRDIGRITYSDGLACVRTGDKFGYIDRTGKYVINPQFDEALPFIDSLALVVNGRGPTSQIGWIDKSGKYIWKQADEPKASGSTGNGGNSTNANESAKSSASPNVTPNSTSRVVTCKFDGVHVRDSPNMTAAVITDIQSGQQIRVVSESTNRDSVLIPRLHQTVNDTWSEIQVEGSSVHGWVFSGFLR